MSLRQLEARRASLGATLKALIDDGCESVRRAEFFRLVYELRDVDRRLALARGIQTQIARATGE